MVLHDQHVHSSFSEDSNQEIKEYYDFAKKIGCKYFITTEHIDLDVTLQKCDWVVDFKKLKQRLNEIKEPNGPIPLLGVEIGFRIDLLDELYKWINSEYFDLINLSIHDNGKVEYYFVDYFIKNGIKKTMIDYYTQMMEAVNIMDNFDVLSHIDYAYKTCYKIDSTYIFLDDEELIRPILETIIKKGKALEINSKVQNALPDEHLIKLLEFYKKLGGEKITLSSDAHTINRYLDNFEKYKNIIKECGFNYLCYYIKRKEYHYDI